MAQAVKADVPAPGSQEALAAVPPSEFLGVLARAHVSECIGASNALLGFLQAAQRPSVLGPGGESSAPKLNLQAETVLDFARLLKGQAVIIDLLLTFLTGKPELKPIPAKTND